MRHRPLQEQRCTASTALVCAALVAGAPTAAETFDHQETRQLVALVEDAAALVASDGPEAACKAFREAGARWLGAERYVFVLDMEGNALCHPARPSLEGRSLLELHDPDGRPIVRNFLRELAGEEPDSWVHYLWPRPGTETLVWKSSYVRRARGPDGRELVVGSGLYQMPMERSFVIEQVEDAVALIEERGEAAFETLRDPTSGFRFLDAYVFIMDEEGIERVNAGFPELEGQNLLDFEDHAGKLVSREMLEKLRTREAAWVEYLWPRPGDDPDRPSEKSSYVRRAYLDGKLLVVGAGVYFD